MIEITDQQRSLLLEFIDLFTVLSAKDYEDSVIEDIFEEEKSSERKNFETLAEKMLREKDLFVQTISGLSTGAEKTILLKEEEKRIYLKRFGMPYQAEMAELGIRYLNHHAASKNERLCNSLCLNNLLFIEGAPGDKFSNVMRGESLKCKESIIEQHLSFIRRLYDSTEGLLNEFKKYQEIYYPINSFNDLFPKEDSAHKLKESAELIFQENNSKEVQNKVKLLVNLLVPYYSEHTTIPFFDRTFKNTNVFISDTSNGAELAGYDLRFRELTFPAREQVQIIESLEQPEKIYKKYALVPSIQEHIDYARFWFAVRSTWYYALRQRKKSKIISSSYQQKEKYSRRILAHIAKTTQVNALRHASNLFL